MTLQPTIKDIARATGVSHGTVSNVLNKRGNVSAEKIRIVEQAAIAMGYKINNKARALRQGSTCSLAMLLPTLETPEYIDLYTNAKNYADSRDYTLHLFITNDLPAQEKEILKELIALRINGILAVTCLQDPDASYQQSGLRHVRTIFLERPETDRFCYVGFDFHHIGQEIGMYILQKQHKNVAVFTGQQNYKNHQELVRGMTDQTNEATSITHIGSHMNQMNKAAFELLADQQHYDIIVVSSPSLVNAIESAYALGSLSERPDLICLSPLRSYPDRSIMNYQLNYKLMGQCACEQLIDDLNQTKLVIKDTLLAADGFEKTYRARVVASNPKELNLLFLDCPSTTALRKLSPDFTKKTGIQVNFHVFPISEIYDVIDTMTDTGIYDVIRLDMAWLSWFAPRSLLPLHTVNPNIEQVFTRFLPAMKEKYCNVQDTVYALPFDPSVQMMFFRSDLFEDPLYKRAYFEQTKSHLQVPQTFEEYNQVVRFFTQAYNPDSPTKFGATLALGYPTSIAVEFLTRLLSQPDLYDDRKCLNFHSPSARVALQSLVDTAQYANTPDSHWWESVVHSFSSGQAATTIVYTNHASDIIHAQDSTVAGKIGYATVPGQKPIIGGGVLGISRFSKQVEEAYSFLDWASSESIASPITMIGGTSPCTGTYANGEIINLYPWLQHLSDNIRIGERNRVFSLVDESINQRSIEHALGIATKNAIIGTFTMEEALSYAAKSLEKNKY